MSAVEAQRMVTRIALVGLAQSGFALAGSGAIREHGVIQRPTEDIDLFTSNEHADRFDESIGRVVDDLRQAGYATEEIRRARHFARLRVQTVHGIGFDVDLGIDWRANAPVTLDVGPVLSLEDAVGNKVSALYSRGEARDYLDVDAIRHDGRFTDEQLLAAAAERDQGFDVGRFGRQLEAARRLQPVQVARYGISADDLQAVQERCLHWAVQLREEPAR